MGTGFFVHHRIVSAVKRVGFVSNRFVNNRLSYGKQMNKETKLRIHNITAKPALKFGSEAWVLKKREEQRLEAAQMKFLRHLLGITKLDKEKTNVLGKKQEQRI